MKGKDVMQRIRGARGIARRLLRRYPHLRPDASDIMQDACLLVLEGKDTGYMTTYGRLYDQWVWTPSVHRRLLADYATGARTPAQRCADGMLKVRGRRHTGSD